MTYAPRPPLLGLGHTTGFGGFQTVGTPQYSMPPATASTSTNPYDAWAQSEIGRRWIEAQESAARQARKQADFEMDQKLQAAKLARDQLAVTRGQAEANAWYNREQVKIARERLAQEERLKQQELQLSRERLALDSEVQRGQLGLNRAQAQAQFMSGPDMLFMGNDFRAALARADQGLGPQPYGANGAPTPRTAADFEALMGPPGTSPGGPSEPIMHPSVTPSRSTGAMYGSGQMTSPSGAGRTNDPMNGGGRPATDPRITAANAVIRAIPPSEADGYDESDRAALAAVENIFRAAKPGAVQRMRPGQRQAFAAGLSRLGFWAPDALEDMQRSAPRQVGARLY